jgi:tetratricopeptide (TPR) repeat protein
MLLVALWLPCRSLAQDAHTAAAPSGAALENAGADAAADDGLNARKLFLEGRALLERGQAQAACQLLERSHQLAPTLGTLLNLGLCHRYSGRLATAHDYYRRAEVMATLAGDTERREFAHNEAAAIAAQRATLTLRVSGDPAVALDVRLDDVSEPREVWERPMFIDAGEHRISVQAPDAPDQPGWQGVVTVVDGGRHLLVIPDLRPQSAEANAAPEMAAPLSVRALATRAEPAAAAAEPKTDSGLNAGRVVALSLAGAGLAALGVGLAYGVAAHSSYSKSVSLCQPDTDVCTSRGVGLRDDAQADASVATALSVAGGAALLSGIVVWFLAQPSAPEREKPLALAVSPSSVTAEWRCSL